jgi:para-nitrobenzyl esterase
MKGIPHHQLLSLLSLAGVALACGSEPKPEPPVADESTRRTLAQGEVIGYMGKYGDHAWRGLPYAKAPVGALRWRAPRPPEAWTGTLEALDQSAPCPQFASPGGGPKGEKPGEPIGSEDCLYANVFTPRFDPADLPEGDRRLPVMLWIHGGGNTIGSSALYNGGRLATRHDLVVVTINYRMGAFGWFTHPSLRLEGLDARDLSGNWGTLDLIQALAWTRDNAAAFGGDPENITVFGESAGGTNVFSLLVSPAARGRFQRAISQSGGLRTTPRSKAENLRDASEPGDDWSSGEVLLRLFMDDGAVDRSAAKVRLASMSNAEIARYLRDKSADEILSVYQGDNLGGMYRIPGLIRDGYVIPMGEPSEVFARPDGTANVPTILGTNRDENKLFLLFGSRHVQHLFGLPLWFKDEEAYDLSAEYQSDAWKVAGVDEPADAMRRARRAPVFAYRFDWDEEPRLLWADFSKLLGAAHALEIPFVFGTFDLGPGNRFLWEEERIPARDALSDAMMSYWANFAYAGDPDRGRSGTLESWKTWDASSEDAPKFMILDTHEGGGIRMSADSITRDELLARLGRDERFENPRDRCEIYYELSTWRNMVSAEDYASACGEFPMDDYPWDE